MRVLVIGEGAHELEGNGPEGALVAIVRRFLPAGTQIQRQKWSADIGRLHGKGDGIFKKAVRWMQRASEDDYDALVAVIDEDGDSRRVRSLTNAQEYAGVEIPRAMGIAIREFDAWMLADQMALSKVLGVTIQTQPNPEAERDPKSRCAQILHDSGAELAQRDMYTGVAKLARVEILEARCPNGFGVFAARLRSLALA